MTVELEIRQVMAAQSYPPRKMRAQVVGVLSLSHDVYRVELSLLHRHELKFFAGQYLAVELPGAGPCYFSIASGPDAPHLELHIQAVPESVSARRVIDTLTPGSQVTLSVPHGKACLQTVPDKPLLLVVAGTGFAQAKSMMDYLRANGCRQPVTLYWGVRCQQDMYLLSLAQQWQAESPAFTFVPVVGDNADNDWTGHHDQLAHAVLASAVDWSNVRVVASGSPAMVYTLMDSLLAAGLPAAEFLSDVLEYAPRG
ncbi:FAD-binding oxidoreductase [Marinobacter sp. X15-166B]|uniref:FAD-binding oxidoreductase n=1 Tax=Marinobacter sp. X15-166B TaxID=1897620 RepID=UPI00085C3DAE|nr:FAD-binding oxidoreductase [Marinobacter sp. X15-166B]OEY66444.1 NAD(P)H-flavin reductase [Marinobacter sp. X15-166B]